MIKLNFNFLLIFLWNYCFSINARFVFHCLMLISLLFWHCRNTMVVWFPIWISPETIPLQMHVHHRTCSIVTSQCVVCLSPNALILKPWKNPYLSKFYKVLSYLHTLYSEYSKLCLSLAFSTMYLALRYYLIHQIMLINNFSMIIAYAVLHNTDMGQLLICVF